VTAYIASKEVLLLSHPNKNESTVMREAMSLNRRFAAMPMILATRSTLFNNYFSTNTGQNK
jgi:hypothetical protein